MEKKNDLHISSTSSSSERISNKRGRPTMEKAVKFGPQPMSIMAQMLHKMRTETTVDKPASDKPEVVCLDNDDNEWDPSDEGSEFTCEVSSHRSNNLQEHKKHLTTHKQYACSYPNCTYSCKLSSNLIKHKRIHTGERPYLCDRCSFRSNFINSLKAHKRIHTSERPYQCQHCSYKCNSSSNLKKHCLHRHPASSSN